MPKNTVKVDRSTKCLSADLMFKLCVGRGSLNPKYEIKQTHPHRYRQYGNYRRLFNATGAGRARAETA